MKLILIFIIAFAIISVLSIKICTLIKENKEKKEWEDFKSNEEESIATFCNEIAQEISIKHPEYSIENLHNELLVKTRKRIMNEYCNEENQYMFNNTDRLDIFINDIIFKDKLDELIIMNRKSELNRLSYTQTMNKDFYNEIEESINETNKPNTVDITESLLSIYNDD